MTQTTSAPSSSNPFLVEFDQVILEGSQRGLRQRAHEPFRRRSDAVLTITPFGGFSYRQENSCIQELSSVLSPLPENIRHV